MTRDNIEEQCRRISPNYSSSGACGFVRGGVLCFIDTSQTRSGTRGIAFMREKIILCLDGGSPREIPLSDIKEIRLISSFEDFFADELALVCEDGEVRISDYSLDKLELKRFIETLTAESRSLREQRALAEEYAKIIAERLAQSTLREERAPIADAFETVAPQAPELVSVGEATDGENEPKDDFIPEEGEPFIRETVIEIPSEKTVAVPEDHEPVPIPEERINWISGSFYAKNAVTEETPVIAVAESAGKAAAEAPREPVVLWERKAEEKPAEPIVLYSRNEEEAPRSEAPETTQSGNADGEISDDEGEIYVLSEGEALTQIQSMSREETLSFLSESLNEINGGNSSPHGDVPGGENDDNGERVESEQALDIGADLKTISEISVPPEQEQDDGKLTEEPIWGDIYIKASRNLRELIESGRLSMEQIETELRDKLLSSARAFAEITADEAKVPKVLMPRITELRSAAGDFEEYFKSGEDIGVRAMFFMLYQMLSYADRIAETPETKERLNDFFRRFGTAGITLSMLDMRV